MLTIPKIIHQVWKTIDLPDSYFKLSGTWKNYLSGWEYKFWTYNMVRQLISDNYPFFLRKYDSYSHEKQKANAAAYFILQKYGGLYIDNAFECLSNKIEGLLENASFIAAQEPKWHATLFCTDYIICNAFMAAEPDNSFIRHVCKKLLDYPETEINLRIDILDTTGSFLLTDAYNEYADKEKIRILDSGTLYPIGMYENQKLHEFEIPENLKERIDGAYAVYYFSGSC